MKAYKYETIISETGQIKLHLNSQLFDKEVEIIIVPKQETSSSELKVSDFLDQWLASCQRAILMSYNISI
jgi:hypothetical protein